MSNEWAVWPPEGPGPHGLYRNHEAQLIPDLACGHICQHVPIRAGNKCCQDTAGVASADYCDVCLARAAKG
jgi:hypothetical protein